MIHLDEKQNPLRSRVTHVSSHSLGVEGHMSFDSSEPKQCTEWLNLVTQTNPWWLVSLYRAH